MPVNKQHDEFYALDLGHGWETPPGYPDGFRFELEDPVLERAIAGGYAMSVLPLVK